MSIIRKNNRIGLPELLFTAGLLISLIPVFRHPYFITLDGAAHCYNANILRSLLSDPDGFYKSWFRLNPFAVPNYSGHLLLILLHTVVSWNMAEKAIVVLFLILVPLLFRKIVLLSNPGNRWWPLAIFPFTHYILLYYGFYNFSLGIVFLLAGIYIRLKSPALSARQLLTVFLISAALYFSHLFTFLIYLFFIAAQEISQAYKTKDLKAFMGRCMRILMATAPFLLLTLFYFRQNPSSGGQDLWPASKTLQFSMSADYLKVYNLETNYCCNMIAYTVFIIALAGTLIYVKRRLPGQADPARPIFLLLFIAMMVLAFVMPNTSGNAGYITYRFIYLGMLFLLLWTGSLSLKPLISATAVALILICHAGILLKNDEGQKIIYAEYEDYIKAGSYIADHSVVAPLFFSPRGFTEHFSNYLCGDKELVILENYEAATNYFPVQWKREALPRAYFSDSLAYLETGMYPTSGGQALRVPDYIVIHGQPTEQFPLLLTNIAQSFSLIYSNKTVSLYKKRAR